ncbi:MAG: hypothetical protein AAGF88_08795 [Pseudomonadota bacterium]
MRQFNLILFAIWPLHAYSAELEVVSVSFEHDYFSVEVHLSLTGEIVAGDTGRLSQQLGAMLPNHSPNALTSIAISLNSEGGSFAEGVELMRYFHDQAISTVVEDGNRCLSACAIAFLGGNFVNEASLNETRRVLHPGGQLGFHAPRLEVGGDNLVPASLLQNSYGQALAALGSLMQEAENFDIQLSLLQTIIETPPSDMYLVETVDDVARWRIQVPAPGVETFATRTELARLCDHFEIWDAGNSVIERSQGHGSYFAQRQSEWAGQFQFVDGRSVGIPARYAHVQTVEFEYNTYCVVEMLFFGAIAGQSNVVQLGVNYTNGSPQATIDDLQSANITNNLAPPLFRYPPEMLISDLPRVRYP